MTIRAGLFVIVVMSLLPACGFDPLVEAPPANTVFDDLPGAITINGIQVSPAVIHPGDTVILRDPVRPEDGPPYALYYWTTCNGPVAQKNLLAREVTWLAPAEPGIYAVTANITNRERSNPSRVLPLCVVPEGQESCLIPAPVPQTLTSLMASPNSFIDCPGGCEATLKADVHAGQAESIVYRWQTQSGEIIGAQAEATWHLPRVDCCTETFTAVLTTCSPGGRATTGFTTATVVPQ